MDSPSSLSSSSHILVFLFFLLSLPLFSFSSSSEQTTTFKDIGPGNPGLNLVPSPLSGSKVISCERVRVSAVSRLKIASYANSFKITLTPSITVPERLRTKIEVCFHRNASLGLCQCGKDEWKAIQKGNWSSFTSPYEERYFDIKFADETTGSLSVSLEEEFQPWRFYCLAFGFVLLLFAPIVSNWVPFYYSSSMAIGVLLVVLILLFQGMKLLPTGRKSAFYLTIYGSALGIGSYLVHYSSMLINSVLANFGLSEEMHNPVSIFVLVGIVLAGAALGYWIVRKFVISEDGSVDIGIAQFMKWAVRIISVACILQSTLDTPLAMVALANSWCICSFITSRWRGSKSVSLSCRANGSVFWRKTRQASAGHKRADFLSRTPKKSSGWTFWSSPKKSSPWSGSPVKAGLVLSFPNKEGTPHQEYYSTFHKTPTRKRFSRKEWEEFTTESTRQAMVDLASSPEFTDWIIDNADRIQLQSDDSSDDSMESGSVSSEETVLESGGGGPGFFKWFK